jgi:hypothetical protein
MSAEFCAAAGVVAMELGVGDVLGLQQGIAITAPSPRDSDLGLLKRAGLTQAAAAAPYPSPFLDEEKMLRFSKAAHTLHSGLDASSVLINTFFPHASSFFLSIHMHCRTGDITPHVHGLGWICSLQNMLDRGSKTVSRGSVK